MVVRWVLPRPLTSIPLRRERCTAGVLCGGRREAVPHCAHALLRALMLAPFGVLGVLSVQVGCLLVSHAPKGALALAETTRRAQLRRCEHAGAQAIVRHCTTSNMLYKPYPCSRVCAGADCSASASPASPSSELHSSSESSIAYALHRSVTIPLSALL